MGAYGDRIKRYYKFSLAETRNLLIAILVLTFIFAFNDGRETFDSVLWFGNFIKVLIIVVISVFIHESAHKLVGLSASYRTDFRLWPYGIVIGLLLTVVSNGKLYFLAPGGVLIHHLAIHRLGMFRYGLSSFYSTFIAFAGPLANIVLALIVKIISFSFPSQLLTAIITINLWYAIFSSLPIPPLDGSTGFFGGRVTYYLGFSLVAASSIMIFISNTLVLMLFGILFLSLLFWFLFYIFMEREKA